MVILNLLAKSLSQLSGMSEFLYICSRNILVHVVAMVVVFYVISDLCLPHE